MPKSKPTKLVKLDSPEAGKRFLAVGGRSINLPQETSVWAGPESPADNGGITFSLLSRFLVCPERFRLLVVEGLKPADHFNHKIEYGQCWHVCEEALAKGPDPTNKKAEPWAKPLADYAFSLCQKYPMAREQVQHWYNVCKVQFPVYVDHWAKHPDVKGRRPLLQEVPFRVPYTLPSGRKVYLRGKWDSVDLIDDGVWLQENKTKGDIKEGQLQRQLTFDLQTMMYLIALEEAQGMNDYPLPLADIAGVRYDVVRRPLSGGKGSIVRHKGSRNRPEETHQHYYARLGAIINADRSEFFMRWRVNVNPGDVVKFRRQCLDPVLEYLCDWWGFVMSVPDPFEFGECAHWRRPFGVYNVLDEGGSSDLDEYLVSGSTVGLERTDDLFPELT